MSCPYKNRPDIYEDFILERLPEKEREQFFHHAEECRFCRKELAIQQTLITAIRKTGSEEMKKEIRGQIERLRKPASDFNWPFYLKIAAILLFFVIAPGIIYYYNNLSPDWKSKEPVHYQQGPKVASGSDVAPSGTSQPMQKEEKAASQEIESVDSGRDKPEPGTAAGQTSRMAHPKAADEMIVRSRERPEKEEADLEAEANKTRKPVSKTTQQSTESGEKNAPAESQSASEGISALSREIAIGKQSAFSETVSPAGIPVSSRVWRFRDSGKYITIFLTVSDSSFERSPGGYPLEIPVNILRRDSSGVELRWMVPPDFPLTGSAESRRVTEKEDVLMVTVSSEVIYRLHLTSDTTKAVLFPVNNR